MALRLLPSAVSPSPRPGVPLPGHYKKVRSTPRPSPHSPRPHLLAPESTTFTPSSASSTDCSPPLPGRVQPSAAPLLQPVRLTAIPSPFFLNRGEVPRTGAPFRPFSGEPPPRRCPWSTVDRRRSRSTGFPLGKQFLKIPISGILHLGPSVSSKSTRSP
jgi:hypothetical protein